MVLFEKLNLMDHQTAGTSHCNPLATWTQRTTWRAVAATASSRSQTRLGRTSLSMGRYPWIFSHFTFYMIYIYICVCVYPIFTVHVTSQIFPVVGLLFWRAYSFLSVRDQHVLVHVSYSHMFGICRRDVSSSRSAKSIKINNSQQNNVLNGATLTTLIQRSWHGRTTLLRCSPEEHGSHGHARDGRGIWFYH